MSDANDSNQVAEGGGAAQPAFPPELIARAREFFKKGGEVAYTLNYDYAIELYLDGLNSWPDAVEDGHKPLRDIALRRQAAGGKKAGMGDKSKYRKMAAKSPREQMLKAEYLLAKDPSNAAHMQDVIKAAVAGDFRDTANWVADLLFELNRMKDKPSLQTFVFLRDSYSQIENFPRALQACQQAVQMKPNDDALQDSMRDLSAQAAVQRGRYDDDSDFRDSILDREGQEKLQAQDSLVQTEQTREQAIQEARALYEQAPTDAAYINQLVAALSATEKLEHEKEAIAVLEKAFGDSSTYQYRQRASELQIKQYTRLQRNLKAKLAKSPGDAELTQQVRRAASKVLRLELDHYKACVENYPTDMSMRFEYGRRLLKAKQYDEAIPRFQEALNDPKLRVRSLNCIGRCFFYKEWYPDAVDTFQQALEHVENANGELAKELRYNLGRAYEADNNVDEALACYRRIAQIDFNYRDARDRVNALRKKQQENK